MAVGGNLMIALRSTHTGKNEGANLCHDMAELVDVDPESNTTTKLVVGLLASCGLLEKGYHIYTDI